MTFHIRTDRKKPSLDGLFDAREDFDGEFVIPCFSLPKEDPYWYEPMGIVHLAVMQTVWLRTCDGSGEYAFGMVLKKERSTGNTWKYLIGSGVEDKYPIQAKMDI